MNKVTAVRLVVACSMAIWVCAGGCSAVTAETPLSPDLWIRAESELADNTQRYVAASQEESEVKEILVQKIKPGYERFDLELIRSSLAPGFQLRYVSAPGTVEIQMLEDYIRSRNQWKIRDNPSRQLLFSIREMRTNPTRTKVSAIIITTYKSRFFSPRFIETYLFERIGEQWLLKTLGMVPIHPQRPELYHVDIFVSDTPGRPSPKVSLDEMVAKGPDVFVERYLKQRRDQGIPGDEVERTVLFVFREPPPPGSSIRVEHQFWRPWARDLRPYQFTYTVRASQPFFVIENRTQAGGRGGTITYRIFINGAKVGEKVVQIL